MLLSDHIEFWKRRAGIEQLLYREASWDYYMDLTQWHELKVKIYGAVPTIIAYVDGFPEITIKDLPGPPLISGRIGLGVDADASSTFGKVKVQTLHPDAFGAQSVILLLVEFSDLKHSLSPQEVYENVFPTLNSYYTEVSYNQTWIIGSVTPTWKMLERPSTYYDIATVTASGWSKGRAYEFLRDAINAWDPEVDFRKYDHVFVAGAGESIWGFAYFPLNIQTNDGVAITGATAQRESYDWRVYAHELGHLFGLPDLYSYRIAFTGPADFREAAVYVGPWDLMSRSNERPQIGAWGKIKLGWITPDRVLELLPEQEGWTTLEPLETMTSGIQAVVAYINITTYYVVEDRQPIGFDEVLPDKGVLVSFVDEAKYWRGNGPLVVQDANPESGPRWLLTHPTFDVGPGKKSQFTSPIFDLAVSLFDKRQDSYIVAVGKSNHMDSAKSAYQQAKDLLGQAESLLTEASAKTYQAQEARELFAQAMKRYTDAKQAFANRTLASLQEAAKDAKEAVRLFNEAKQAELRYQLLGGGNNFVYPAAAVTGVATLFLGLYIVRKRKRARST